MFKVGASIILFFALVAQTFKGEMVVINYYTNTSAFAKNCVNKARPKLHCNGKCQMMKKLQEEERREEQAPERKGENEITICLASFFIDTPEVPVKFVTQLNGLYHSKWNCINYNVEIFHPPKLS